MSEFEKHAESYGKAKLNVIRFLTPEFIYNYNFDDYFLKQRSTLPDNQLYYIDLAKNLWDNKIIDKNIRRNESIKTIEHKEERILIPVPDEIENFNINLITEPCDYVLKRFLFDTIACIAFSKQYVLEINNRKINYPDGLIVLEEKNIDLKKVRLKCLAQIREDIPERMNWNFIIELFWKLIIDDGTTNK